MSDSEQSQIIESAIDFSVTIDDPCCFVESFDLCKFRESLENQGFSFTLSPLVIAETVPGAVK